MVSLVAKAEWTGVTVSQVVRCYIVASALSAGGAIAVQVCSWNKTVKLSGFCCKDVGGYSVAGARGGGANGAEGLLGERDSKTELVMPVER